MNMFPSTALLKRQRLEEIRRQLKQVNGMSFPVTALGLAEIDRVLPWGGLPCGLHEVTGLPHEAAAGFTAWLSAVVGAGRWALWCRSAQRAQAAGQIYGPALAQFGIDMARLWFADTAHSNDGLWAMEEGLRARRFAVVIGEGVVPDLTQTRRLQLAAETGAATALMVLPPRSGRISAAMTRWAVRSLPADGPGRPRWRVQLERCRGGAHGVWHVEWNDETLRLDLSAPLADRPLAAAE